MTTARTDEGHGEQGGRRPFSFSVQFGDGLIGSFDEASGLTSDTNVVDYREGHVTLRHGSFAGDAEVLKMLREFAAAIVNPAKRCVTIRQLDPNGAARMTWTLNNAWPVKFTGPELNAEGNEVAIEELVLTHEGLEILTP